MVDTIADKYCIFIGTSRGVLLNTTCKPKERKYEKSSEASEITALEWGRSENEIVIGYKNGNFAIYDSLQNKFVNNVESTEEHGAVVGIGCLDNSVITGRQDGIIHTWTPKLTDYFPLDLIEDASLNCVKMNTFRHGIIGTGGELSNFQLWNVETHQCVFKSKSLGHDELNLPIRTSVRSITFFPEDSYLSCCATKEGHVLLYDDRAQRKPIVKFLDPEVNRRVSYTTVACAFRQRQCLVGTTTGYIRLLDMKAGKCMRTLKSFTGSVTSIACDSVEPYVASTSLDMHLRVHNLDTKELVYKHYMQQHLTKLLMKPVVKEEKKEETLIETNVDHEYEELFNNMETISETSKSKTKRKKDNSIKVNPAAKKKKKKLKP